MPSEYTGLPFDPRGVWKDTPDTDVEDDVVGNEYHWFDETYKQMLRLRVVKNISGIALTQKRLVTFTAGSYETTVDGYADAVGEYCRPIWDKHGTTIADDDLCYVVMEGWCLVTTGLAADELNNMAVGDWLTSETNAASTNSTAGLALLARTTGATNVLAEMVLSTFGRCMTARTTSNTNTDTLVVVRGSW